MQTNYNCDYIEKIHLQNFKKFDHATFRFHPNLTALIGDNATGKTSILHALAIALNSYFLRSGFSGGYSGVKDDDIRVVRYEKESLVADEGQHYFSEVSVSASACFHNEHIEWKRKLKDRGGSAHQLIALAADVRSKVSQGIDCDLPVILYYGIGRLWDTHFRVKGLGKPESRLAAYKNCLDPRSDQKTLTKWLQRLEMAAWQEEEKIPALECVRKAVTECIPRVKRFYYSAKHGELMIRFEDGLEYPFGMLSDGYRNMIGIVADIAHRAARLNPHMGINANQARGVVLIDEVDLHLHPKWQRQVINDLRRVFPNIQFIVTTHSPFILQSLSEGEVIDLNRHQGEEDNIIANLAAHSVEDIVEDYMGVKVPQRSQRYQDMYDAATEYYKTLDLADNADPIEKEKLKKKLEKLSAPFSDNVAYHAFLERKRLLSGLQDDYEGEADAPCRTR